MRLAGFIRCCEGPEKCATTNSRYSLGSLTTDQRRKGLPNISDIQQVVCVDSVPLTESCDGAGLYTQTWCLSQEAFEEAHHSHEYHSRHTHQYYSTRDT